jgi:TolA-binding protein
MTETIAVLIGAGATSITTWYFARRKNNALAESSELDNIDKAIKIWRELSQSMETRFKAEIEELRKENCDLQTKVSEMIKKNEEMKTRVKALENENKKLIGQLKIYNSHNPKQDGSGSLDDL